MLEKSIGQKTAAGHKFLSSLLPPSIRPQSGADYSKLYGEMRRLIISCMEEKGQGAFFHDVAVHLAAFEKAVAPQPEPSKMTELPSHLKNEFEGLGYDAILEIVIEAFDALNDANVPLTVALVYAKAREFCQEAMQS